MTPEEEISNQPPAGPQGEVRPVKKQSRFRKSLHDILGGDYLSKESVLGNLPYLLFVTVLAMIYIGNTYYAEKTYKAIEKTKSELKELRFEYLTTKSTLMFHSKLSEIVRRSGPLGLKESMVPPYKIFYTDKDLRSATDTNQAAK
ncbi:MAG TPA: FtsL-like putative cell division protein [Bacteroidales bacterium]|nr:FtsL-like putative cell division protein [Bacteroidales bacterium]